MRSEVVQSYNRLLYAIFGEPYGHEYRTPVNGELLVESIDKVLSTLPGQSRRVLTLRFGLADGELMTWDDLSREMNLAIDEVKEVESEAMRLMRHPSRSQLLEVFLPAELG